jgi:hydroxysqualene synthase
MIDPIPAPLKEAYRVCEKQTSAHYENFPVASLLLPKATRPHVAALYAFARTADDFADEDRYEGRRLKEIDAWERGLGKALQGKDSPLVLQAFAHTLRTFQIPMALPLDLLRAYRMDLKTHRYSTWNSLLYYCRHSANPVGRMVLYISGYRDQKLHLWSDFICSGLQLINFWQDSAIDLKRGRIYYPNAEIKKAGVKPSDLLALRDSPRVRALVRESVRFTDNYFRRGFPLLGAVRGRLRLELRATYLGGQGILSKIRALDYNVLQERPAWNALDKALLALRSLAGSVQP